jgi:hypothetical protein
MTLVGSNFAKEQSNQLTSSEESEDTVRDLLHEAIQPHDVAPVLLRTADDGIIKLDLESGLNEPHTRPVSQDHIAQRSKLASSPPTITEDGTGVFYMNDRPISPPSRAHIAADRARDSMDERPLSAASSYATEGRRGSVDSEAGHTAGGGRSARDRKKRTRRRG